MKTAFETYLADKKIDSQTFKENEPERWQEFYALFEVVHPESFTVQKKFLINTIRRQYPLKTPVVVPESEAIVATQANAALPPAKPARPVLKRPVIVKKPEQEQ